MEEPRGAAAIDTIERPTLPPLPPAIHAVRNPGSPGTVPPVAETEVDEVPIIHEDVEVFSATEIPPTPDLAVVVEEPVAEVVVEPAVAELPAEVEPETVPDAPKQTKAPALALDNKKLLIGLFAVFAVLFVAAGVRVSGVLTNTSLVTSLESGDCIEDFFTPNQGQFREVFLVGTTNCSNPHAYEVYAVGESVYSESEYPGIEGVFAEAQSYCDAQYASFVGGDFLASPWNVWTFAPTEDRWNSGERNVQCLVGDFDQASLTTGSLQGAGR